MLARRRSRLEALRVTLPDSARTTIHVASYERSMFRPRIVLLEHPAPLVRWCKQQGIRDAIVGGFFIRSRYAPLGELQIDGQARDTVPFAAPWGHVRACVQIDQHIRIARRDADAFEILYHRYARPVFGLALRRLGDRLQEYAQVPVMIGDRAFVYLGFNKVPVAMIVQANLDGASFDRTSSFANWTRSYRAEDLVPVINRRNPIQQLINLRPVTIDASQRIAELEVTAEGGRKFMLRGLPIRWSLNVPDNLFVYEKTKDPDGMDRYTFFGKGWGHGIGFCQVGSYGMAFRGWTYDRILKHYYTGVEIVPMGSASR